MIVCVKFDDGRKPATFEKATGYWLQDDNEPSGVKMIRVKETGKSGYPTITEIPFDKIESITVVYGE